MLSKVSSSNPISVSLERKHIGDSDYHIPSNEMTAVTAATTSESDAKEQPWSQNFKPREPIELTSNCKQLSRTFKDEFRVYFLLEYIQGMDLFDVLRELGLLNDEDSKFYIACLLVIVEYLHQ